MTKQDTAPAKQLMLPLNTRGEILFGEPDAETPVKREQLMERVVERENLLYALRQVKSNRGSPGVDGMTVDELPRYLKEQWPRIREELLAGAYQPARRLAASSVVGLATSGLLRGAPC